MKIDQCLFGYDDGHKLIASSIPLGTEESLLTELSDLAPGTVFGRSDGYWTGVPAPSIGRYVLMRTWPAPEMSRPGCVWTHALLIEPSLLETIGQLSILQTLAIRPISPVDKSRYCKSIAVDSSLDTAVIMPLDQTIVKQLLLSLYTKSNPVVEVNSPGELEAPLFAVWSQQWPRLRRNFRFQTATSQAPTSLGTVRFDIAAALSQRPEVIDKGNTTWLAVATNDVNEGSRGTLRNFLWHYGEDVRRQRSSFKPLIEIHQMNIEPSANDTASRLIEVIRKSFLSLENARLLKQDLVDGVLVPSAQPILLLEVLRPGDPYLPAPTSDAVSKLKKLWPDHKNELLELAELTAEASDSLSGNIFEAVKSQITDSEFWSLTSKHPLIRKRMLREHPKLLIDVAAQELDDETLADHLSILPRKTRGLQDLIYRLLTRKHKKLANVAFEKFPDITSKQIIKAANSSDSEIPAIWFNELIARPKILLKPDVMGLISRASLLYKIADSLGWFRPEIMAAGPGPWIKALNNSSNDLWGEQEDRLNCFILMLALFSGGEDGRAAVELLFDTVHERVLDGRLYGLAKDTLSFWLPEHGWFSGWDIGFRLRMLVAETYVRCKWPVDSYGHLARDKKVRVMLADAASDVTGGAGYSDAVSW